MWGTFVKALLCFFPSFVYIFLVYILLLCSTEEIKPYRSVTKWRVKKHMTVPLRLCTAAY